MVNTGFATNLSDGLVAQAAPELSEALKNAMEQIRREKSRELPPRELEIVRQMGGRG